MKQRKSKDSTTNEPNGSESAPGIFKESRDILKEFEEYTEYIENDENDQNNYFILLFKNRLRIYVAMCLMQTFSFTE